MTHEELQRAVVELAHLLGWRHLHVRRSIGKGRKWQTTTNLRGWPDLLLWSTRAPGRHLAVEIKVPPDRLSPEQYAVLAEMADAGFECHVVTPDDLERLAPLLRWSGGGPTSAARSLFTPGVTDYPRGR